MARHAWPTQASGTMPIRTQYSVALLHDARPPPAPPAARAAASAARSPRSPTRCSTRRRRSRSSSRCSSARPACALLERAGRGVRLTDAALVLVAPRRRAARPRRARRGRPRRGRRQRDRPRPDRGLPVGVAAPRPARRWPRWRATRRGLRCELVEAEPEQALPALALGDLDLVLGDEWQHQPWRLPAGLERHELLRDPVSLRAARRAPGRPRARRGGAARRAGRRAVGDRARGHGLGGRRRSGPAASSAASSPTSATARTTRPSASRSSPGGSR